MKRRVYIYLLIGIIIGLILIIILDNYKSINKIENKNKKINEEINKKVKLDVLYDLQLLDSNILHTSLNLDIEDVKYYVGKIPVYNTPKGTMYIAIKPEKNKNEKVKRALDIYISNLEVKLENKEEDKELEYIKNIIKEEYKGYYIYSSGKKAKDIVKILKNNLE